MSPPNDTRERILDSARELIYTRSYATVGVAEICADAGVKKGSFYHFFPSKRDLTVAVLDSRFADLKRYLLDRAFTSEIAPLDRLARLVDGVIAFQTELHHQTGMVPGCPFGNLAAEQSTQDEVLRCATERSLGRIGEAISRAVADALAAGEIGRIDVTATADAMLAYLEGVILLAKARNDPAVLAQLLPAMLDIRIEASDGR